MPGSDENGGQSQRLTKTALIAMLRDLESKLWNWEVVDEVKKLSHEEQAAFFGARLSLASTIARLNASLMRDIYQALEVQADALRQGIGEMSDSIDSLESAAAWAGCLNNIVGILGRVIVLI